MPPDPTVVIVFGTLFLSLVLSLIYAFLHQVLKYKAAKSKAGQDPSRSIGVSELEALIREAVAEATVLLQERVNALEAEVQVLHEALTEDTKEALSSRDAEPLLALPVQEEEHEMATNRARKHVR